MKPFDYEANKHLVCTADGRRLTVGLFEELSRDDVLAKPPFRLSDWHKTYVEVGDLTGYKAAEVLLGNWEHWLLLCKAPAFAAVLKEWNEEVSVKLRSEALANLVKQSKLPTGTAAAKQLLAIAEGKKVMKEADPAKDVQRKVSDDAKRLGLALVK